MSNAGIASILVLRVETVTKIEGLRFYLHRLPAIALSLFKNSRRQARWKRLVCHHFVFSSLPNYQSSTSPTRTSCSLDSGSTSSSSSVSFREHILHSILPLIFGSNRPLRTLTGLAFSQRTLSFNTSMMERVQTCKIHRLPEIM